MVDVRFFKPIAPADLRQMFAQLGAQNEADQISKHILIHGAETLELGRSGDICLAVNNQYGAALADTGAGVVLVSPKMAKHVPASCISVVSDQAQIVFSKILNLIYPTSFRANSFNIVEADTKLAAIEQDVMLCAGAVVGAGAEIGAGTIIGPNAVVGAGVAIGRNCQIGAGVSIECALIGDNVTLHVGVRIGTSGFGWLDHGRSNLAVPQLGRVIIQNGVDIGANSTIDRGALGDTTIGENSKIDNLVQIGHNCQIGRNCLIAAMSGLSGGTILGDGVLMGGAVGTAGHLSIGEGSIVLGRAAITKDWPAGSKLAGNPAQNAREYWQGLASVRRLSRGGNK